jgi:imidazolonepropionase-like amidohydrolase
VYYKVEAYTASEEAGRILFEQDVTPVYVSDNPVLNAQHVVFEAAKAYTFGLPYHAALASVTSAPAELLGLGNRIGKVKAGLDADIVLWDSDPLSVGATPIQVWIDGAAQFEDPVLLKKPFSSPIQPDLTLASSYSKQEQIYDVIFSGVSKIMLADKESPIKSEGHNVVVRNGTISCIGGCTREMAAAVSTGSRIIQLRNGYLAPAFTAFGSGLGLVEIDAEPDTQDGSFLITWARAVDGLLFGGKQLATAFSHGVTRAISAPSLGTIDAKGVSVAFSTGAKHALEDSALVKDEVAAHYILSLGAKSIQTPSISAAVGALRQKLLDAVTSADAKDQASDAKQFSEKRYLQKVVKGEMPLVVTVHSADTMASIIRMKKDVETAISKHRDSYKHKHLRFVVLGGAEAHIVAAELASSNIAVILAPMLPHAQSWDQRRSLMGAPLTNGTTLDALLDAGVLVALGADEVWQTRELGLLAGIAWKNGEGRLSEGEALGLVSRNIYDMLGMKSKGANDDWVVWEGSPLETGGRVRAVGSLGKVALWAE